MACKAPASILPIAASSTQMVSAAEESPSMRAVMSIVFSIT